MKEELIPKQEEIRCWLVDTLKHVCHIEYFLYHLNIGNEDSERPHDLVGPGNKFEWDVIKGFALQYRLPKVNFEMYIMPSLIEHRKQNHHRMWNEPSLENKAFPVKDASVAAMLVGAVDANCSLLENRGYQGGVHDYDGVRQIALKNQPHKTPWMLALIPMMQRLEQPRLDLIVDVHYIPNVGLPDKIYCAIQKRTRDVLEMLSEKGYYF